MERYPGKRRTKVFKSIIDLDTISDYATISVTENNWIIVKYPKRIKTATRNKG